MVVGLFEEMKVSLDLATSASVIAVVVMYIRDKKNSHEKEIKDKDYESLVKEISRLKSSFDDIKRKCLDDCIKLSEIASFESDDHIMNEVQNIDGKFRFLGKFLVEEVKSEHETIFSLVKNKARQKKMKDDFSNAIDSFKINNDIAMFLMSTFIYKMRLNTKKEEFKKNLGVFIKNITFESLVSKDDVNILRKKYPQIATQELSGLTKEYLDSPLNPNIEFKLGLIPILNQFFSKFTISATTHFN